MWGDGRDRDVELEFWWETLAYWDDYVAGTKTFDRKGAGIARHRAGSLLPQPRRRLARGAPLFEERAFLDGLDLETNGRAAVAFDANGDGALDLFVRSVQAPEALFLGSRRPERALPAAASRRRAGVGQPRRHRRARRRRGFPAAARSSRENGNASGYLVDRKPDRPPRPGRRDAPREPDRPLAFRRRSRSWARSKPWTGRSSSTQAATK